MVPKISFPLQNNLASNQILSHLHSLQVLATYSYLSSVSVLFYHLCLCLKSYVFPSKLSNYIFIKGFAVAFNRSMCPFHPFSLDLVVLILTVTCDVSLYFGTPLMPSHVPYGLRGPPSQLWPKCNRLQSLGRP
jgi:hypothetical protein